MELNCIVGKPKTGKTTHIYESILNDIKNDIEVILFVPSQSRVIAEKQYMQLLEKKGIIGVNITTISEYVKKYIRKNKLYLDDRYISKLDKKIALSKIINSDKNIIKIFKNVKNKSGFLEMIYIYIDLLRKGNINIENLEKIQLGNKITQLKLKEIINIYKLYYEEISKNYIDDIDEIKIFLENINSKNLSKTKIYFDSYNNFNESEFKVIEEFLKYAISITISLTTDITDLKDIYASKTNEIFEVANNTYLRLLRIANKVGADFNTMVKYNNYLKMNNDILYLGENIFSDMNLKKRKSENVYINIVSNRYTEIEKIASIISKKIREGYRYNDFIIYTTNIQQYKDIIKRIFFKYNIPIYTDDKVCIKNLKLTCYILNIIDIYINGLKKDNIIKILKLGLNNISDEDIAYIENYMLEFNILKDLRYINFEVNNSQNNIYDLDRLNNIRERIIKIFFDEDDKELFSINKKKTYEISKIIYTIYNHMIKNNIFNIYSERLRYIENNIEKFESNSFNIESQVWNNLVEIFDSINKMYTEYITLEKFKEIFELLLKDTYVKGIPSTIDTVELVDINKTRTDVKKIIFFIGVNENEFPKISDEDIIFNDNELDNIKKEGIILRETSISKQNMALYNIYIALNNVTEQVYIYIPSSDLNGKSLRPSSIIVQIKKVLDVNVVGSVTQTQNMNENIYTKEDLLNYMIYLLKNRNIKNEEYEEINNKIIDIYNYLITDKKYNEVISYKKDDSNLTKDTINSIYSDNLNTSISRIELFKKCPFSYFMKYCLKVEPRKEYQISNIDIGNFMHGTLEEFSKYLYTNNITWQSLLIENDEKSKGWEDILDSIIINKLNNILNIKKENIKYTILTRKLITTIKKVILVIARSFNQSDFVPYGYEIEFKKNGTFMPIEINLGNFKTMTLIGKIDRVDILRLDDKDYIRVVDYKSSDRSLKLEDIKSGISLQLITYLMAFISNLENNCKTENNKKILPAAMVYFNLSDKLVSLNEYTENEDKIKSEITKSLRMKGIFLKDISIIEKMDKKLLTDERLIDISKITLNNQNTTKALEEKEYLNLFKEADNILKEIGNEIIRGVVRIFPNKKCDHCKFCNYSSVCRKNICV